MGPTTSIPPELADLALPDIVRPRDLARILRCSEATARRLFRSGSFPARRIRGRWMADRRAILAALRPDERPCAPLRVIHGEPAP